MKNLLLIISICSSFVFGCNAQTDNTSSGSQAKIFRKSATPYQVMMTDYARKGDWKPLDSLRTALSLGPVGKAITQIKKDGATVTTLQYDDLTTAMATVAASAGYSSAYDEIRIEKTINLTTSGNGIKPAANINANGNDINITGNWGFNETDLPLSYPQKSITIKNFGKISWDNVTPGNSNAGLFRIRDGNRVNYIEGREIDISSNAYMIRASGVGSKTVVNVKKITTNFAGGEALFFASSTSKILVENSDITNYGSFLAKPFQSGEIHFRNCKLTQKSSTAWQYDNSVLLVMPGTKVIIEDCIIENDGFRTFSIIGTVELRGTNTIKSNGINALAFYGTPLTQNDNTDEDNWAPISLYSSSSKLINYGNLTIQTGTGARFCIAANPASGSNGSFLNYGTLTANLPVQPTRIAVTGTTANVISGLVIN